MLQETVRTIDYSSGELITEEIKNIRNVKADAFMQVYLNDLSGLLQITSRKELILLAVLWRHSTFTNGDNLGNIVCVHAEIKNEVFELTNMTDGAIRNSISKFVKKELLIKYTKGRGLYYLNPVYFFKGALSLRSKTIKYVLEYKIEE